MSVFILDFGVRSEVQFDHGEIDKSASQAESRFIALSLAKAGAKVVLVTDYTCSNSPHPGISRISPLDLWCIIQSHVGDIVDSALLVRGSRTDITVDAPPDYLRLGARFVIMARWPCRDRIYACVTDELFSPRRTCHDGEDPGILV